MVNTAKYLLLLENLKFPQDESPANHMEHNVATLKKFVNKDFATLWQELRNSEQAEGPELPQPRNTTEEYIVYMLHVLLAIVRNTNFGSDAKEDLLATRHVNLCIEAIQDVSVYSLTQQVHPKFCKSGVYKGSRCSEEPPAATNYELLQMTIESFRELVEVQQFHLTNSMELVVRDFMAGIYTLILANALEEANVTEESLKRLQKHLDFVWLQISKLEYFRNLLLLKAVHDLPQEITKKLHMDLLTRLQSKSGFSTFVATILTAKPNQSETKHSHEVIANIVAFRGHSKRFQHIMLKQVFEFIGTCLQNLSMAEGMGVGLLTLRRLYDLNEDNKSVTKELLRNSIRNLQQPEDMLTGLILMEHSEFCLLVDLWFNLFCTSMVECLPSDLLTPYMPMLLEMYYNIPKEFEQKPQIGSLITRCLNNREFEELDVILQKLYTKQLDDHWFRLHERILILPNVQNTELTLKIANAAHKQDYSISLAIPELLMSSDYHILTYRVFMILLKMMSSLVASEQNDGDDDIGASVDLLQTEEELLQFLNTKYPVKVEILLSLNTLISHQPLRAQLNENQMEFMKTLRTLIEQRLQSGSSESSEYSEQTLLIMLSLLQEMLETSGMPELMRDFVPTLRRLAEVSSNELVLQRIASLSSLLSGDLRPNDLLNPSPYNTARSLMESKESHMQVYGIQMLLDLLRRKDPVTLSNLHVIMALALALLKDIESYTFLNCVRLFVGLVNVHEAEVLELLADEYLNDTASMDYRLVVGEAILKVSQELGPLCYKYKDVLLNCFMHGARSNLNEFRMSSFANLSQLCRILSYQVHKFFQELLDLINCELTTGKYLPSKRAAVLVLSELIAGMDNLMDYEEMLLPIYRLLKYIEGNADVDEKMRLHASNGLKALGEKCKSLLLAEQKLHKEIRIFGIKDSEPKKRASILEIN